MSKREKIIFFAVLVGVLYGAYSLFLASPSKQITVGTGLKKGELGKIIADVTGNLTKEILDKADTHIFARAGAEWGSDPFYKTELPKKPKESKVLEEVVPLKQKVDLTYSGYVKMGDKRLAIINDIEYETGEELELPGYIVERIEPLKVKLVIRHEEKSETITVPMVEEIL